MSEADDEARVIAGVTEEDLEMAASWRSAMVFGRGKEVELRELRSRLAADDVDVLVYLFAKHRQNTERRILEGLS